MTDIRKLTALAASLALAGCNLAPAYVRPTLPVPPSAPTGPAYASAEAGGDAAALIDTAWRDFFTEPKLREVIALALLNNRDLQLAVANVERARAQYRGQRAEIFPTIGATGSATFQKSPLGGIPGAGGGQAVGRADIFSVSAGISAWEIDLFGRVRNLTQAAREQFFAVEENRKATRLSLVAEVATAWLTMAADQDRLQVARKTEAAFGQTVELTQARFRAGIASELEVRQARTSLDRARADIAALTTQVAQDQNALNLLAGTTVAQESLPQTLASQGVTINHLPANLSSDLLLRRPDVAAAEHQLIAANADIGAARANFFPRISLTAALGTMSLGLSGLFAGGSETWSVAPSATVPIFDFGRNRANLQGSIASRDAMVAQYEKTVQVAFREVADALARRGTIAAQVDAQRSLNDNAGAAYRLSAARFRAGIDSFLSTLDSQRSWYAAEQDLVTARFIREANAVEVYRALGGGLR
jgi:outer membrane protein, multidrug efflux system